MAPQASIVASGQTVQSSALSTTAPANADHKSWIPIPVALLIFLGLCLAYTLSYILYRIVMSRRRESEEDIPDCPDRGVSRFMNGARLTLNFGNHKSAPLTLDESPHIPDEEKPLTDSLRSALSEIPTSSPADSPSTPFIILTPPFTFDPNRDLGEVQLRASSPTAAESSTPVLVPARPPASGQQPFSQRVVKFLSRDRVEAIALDPKLAPVQGPLRPLSMVPSPSGKKRTIFFGLGLKYSRGHSGDLETHYAR